MLSPGRTIITTSTPPFILGSNGLIASFIFLLTWFLVTAFFENFLLTTIPKRGLLSLFFSIFKNKKSSLKDFPRLKTFSKSFLFFSRLFFGSMLGAQKLDRKLFSALSSAAGKNSSAGFCFLSYQKTVSCLSFPFFGLISKRHDKSQKFKVKSQKGRSLFDFFILLPFVQIASWMTILPFDLSTKTPAVSPDNNRAL